MSPHVVSLKKFMIFNSNEGQTESKEADKLLYHWVDASNHRADLREQIDDICLCDASVTISNKLTCDLGPVRDDNHRPIGGVQHRIVSTSDREPSDDSFKPNEYGKSLVLTFSNTLVIVAQVELDPPIWIAVHVASIVTNTAESAPSQPTVQAQNADHQAMSDEPVRYVDPSTIPTKIIERIVNNIYARFRLLNGSFRMIAGLDHTDPGKSSKAGMDKIRTVCSNYFDIALPQVHLNSIMTNITSIYNYINYLDLNPIALMRVNCFINHLISIDASQIHHSIVIFNDKLLWSSLSAYNTRLVYNYLISVLIRDALQEELIKDVDRVRRIAEAQPIYLTEQENSDNGDDGDDSTSAQIPEQLESETRNKLEKFKKLYLTVFRSSNDMTLGLFLNNENASELLQSCQQVLTKDSRFGVIPLASLAQSIGHTFIRTASNSGSGKLSISANLKSLADNQVSSGGLMSRPMSVPNDSTLKSLISPDSKFVVMDKMDASVTCPMQVCLANSSTSTSSASKDSPGQKLVHLLPSIGSSKQSRIIKWLVELEPELSEMSKLSDSRVDEFLGKTLNDSWIMVTNSRYRTIYSMNKVKNSGLSEAQQCAIQMKSILFGNRL